MVRANTLVLRVGGRAVRTVKVTRASARNLCERITYYLIKQQCTIAQEHHGIVVLVPVSHNG